MDFDSRVGPRFGCLEFRVVLVAAQIHVELDLLLALVNVANQVLVLACVTDVVEVYRCGSQD